jgi:hypothetical protein
MSGTGNLTMERPIENAGNEEMDKVQMVAIDQIQTSRCRATCGRSGRDSDLANFLLPFCLNR